MVIVIQLLSHVLLFVTPWTAAHQASLSMGFSRQEYWSGVPLPSPKTKLTLAYLNTCRYKPQYITIAKIFEDRIMFTLSPLKMYLCTF